jgi:heme-degrading monooxygenase HmoA
MFTVIFEVHPGDGQQTTYLDLTKVLKPELLKIDGFIDVIRYRSLTRDNWVLSISTWRDEKSLVRWRTHAKHHDAQRKGRDEVFSDYHLRIAEVIHDSHPPKGHEVIQQRYDATKVGKAKTAILVEIKKSGLKDPSADEALSSMGLNTDLFGLISWDVFDSILTPGNLIALLFFDSTGDVSKFAASTELQVGARVRHTRIIRDYGMFDREEAPQYYPEIKNEVRLGPFTKSSLTELCTMERTIGCFSSPRYTITIEKQD